MVGTRCDVAYRPAVDASGAGKKGYRCAVERGDDLSHKDAQHSRYAKRIASVRKILAFMSWIGREPPRRLVDVELAVMAGTFACFT